MLQRKQRIKSSQEKEMDLGMVEDQNAALHIPAEKVMSFF